MKQKVFSILALLLLAVTGVWAQTPSWTALSSSSSTGTTIGSSGSTTYYYITRSLSLSNSDDGGSGLTIRGTVYLYIPEGMTLTCEGADANGQTGAGAGIELAEGNTLYIIGGGTVNATGGKAANGGNGVNGSKGELEEKEVWNCKARIVCGVGGNGGYGGGGAGAGIGTAGGNGGVGGSMTENPAESYEDWEDHDLAGITGKAGSAGTSAGEMGTLYIQSAITKNIQGGAAGNGGAAGRPGNVLITGGEIQFEDYYSSIGIPMPTNDIIDMQAVAGGGGGGGGAGGGSAEAIGTGGAGGGGGASGACGSACAYDSWINDYWNLVGAGGGGGGIGTDSNDGAAGYTCWFQGDNNIFEEEQNHKPGGIAGAAGTASVAGTANVAPESIALPATLTDGNDLSDLSAYAGKTVYLTYTRSFTADKPSTVCLPFAYVPKTGETFYTFGGITKDGDDFVATMTEYTGATLAANTPYLYKAASTGDTDFSGIYILPESITAGETTDGDWTFVGTYETIEWTTAPTGIYGFSAQDTGDGITQGQFVKVGEYVRIKPMRCYLKYKSGAEDYAAAARMMAPTRRAADDALPETISVRFIGANGEVTSIATLNTRTGEVSTDGWYTLDGKRLTGQPTQKGIYVNNGKKVIIK